MTSGGPASLEQLYRVIADYGQFHTPRFVDPEVFSAAELSPAEARYHARVVPLYATYLRRNPQFDDTNTTTLLGQHIREMGETLVRTMIEYSMARDFLRSA